MESGDFFIPHAVERLKGIASIKGYSFLLSGAVSPLLFLRFFFFLKKPLQKYKKLFAYFVGMKGPKQQKQIIIFILSEGKF